MRLRQSQSTWLYLARSFPKEFSIVVLSFLVAGAAETIGAVGVVPLLSGFLGDSKGADSPLVSFIYEAMSRVGIIPSLETVFMVVCGSILAKGLLLFVAFKKVNDIEAEAITTLRLQLVDGLLKARWVYYVSQETGHLTHALVGECAQVGAAIRVAGLVFSNLVQAAVYLLAGALLSWKVLVAGLLGGVFFSLLFRKLIAYVRQAGVDQSEALNAMTTTFTDSLVGAKPLKVMGVEGSFIKYIKQQADSYMLAAKRHGLGAGVVASVQEPLIILILAATVFTFKSRVTLEPATFLAMAFFFHRILARFLSVQQGLQQYAALEGPLQSLRAKVDEIEEYQELHTGGIRQDLREKIVFSSVEYGYAGQDVLKDLSLEIPVGQITVVSGRSGAGKTTVADLVSALIRPAAGEVMVDGVSLSAIDLDHWRSQIGYVPQEVFLFNDTIRNNITLGRSFTDQEVRSAMEKAGLQSFCLDTGRDLHTYVGEHGRSLSGGQRQRLMIARALISKPKLLILDEATTGLDEKTEREIWENISSQKPGMAILAISHQRRANAVADREYKL